MQEIFDQAFTAHKAGEFKKAIFIYNRLLNLKPDDETILFLLSDAYMREEFNGLSINLLNNLLRNNPVRADAWCNLGTAYRKENNRPEAEKCWTKAIELAGDTVETCGNMASLYADNGQPDKALEWTKRALKIDHNHVQANWLKSLALLTKGEWLKGFEAYEYRQKLEGWDSRKSIEVPIWNGKKTKHLYIHGEQGVGDEIMFLSCLDEILPLAEQVTIEVNKKVAEIVRQTWKNITVVTTETIGDYSAKVPIGSLAAMNRKTGKFNTNNYLKPSAERIEYYRSALKELGEAPYIGVAWLGGLKATRIEDRTIQLEELKPILDKYTCVSVQYEDTNPILPIERERVGLHKINDLCIGGDLAEQAALFAALDAVVTVQQTAVHVAGAVGTPCYVLLPNNAQWRYGQKDAMAWYKSVKLYRKNGNEWPVKNILKDLADAYQ